MNNIPGKILFDRHEIDRRVNELAEEIGHDYTGKDMVVVGILKGAFMFFADLIRRLPNQPAIDFARLASYGSDSTGSGSVEIRKDIEISIEGRDVLIIEDIIDTGITVNAFIEQLKKRRPRSLRVCTLLDKRERREVELPVDYAGFIIDGGFVVGYGLDYDEKYRCLPDIYILDEERLSGGGL